MTVCDYEQQIDSIKKLTTQKSFHSYFQKHLGSPDFDDDLILMLLIILNSSNQLSKESETYIPAAILVQLALHTHEQVAAPLLSLKERQLNVLAGDYYSGMYYNLLAHMENIELIRSLANAIKTINEHKIAIYQIEADTIESFIHSIKAVESALLEQMSIHFQATEYISLFTEFLFLKKMMLELEKFRTDDHSIIFTGLKKYYFTDQDFLLSQTNKAKKRMQLIGVNFMAESIDRLDELKKALPSLPSTFHSRIHEVTADYFTISRSVMEDA